MKPYILLLIALLLTGVLFAQPNSVMFREMVAKGDTTQTLKLILQEKPDYQVAFKQTPTKDRWLIQLYKDGGDGIISPLDSIGNPTGDDTIVDHPSHLHSTQGLYFVVSHMWSMIGISFYAKGKNEDAWQGDNVYVRIFNSPKFEDATKYIVSGKLYTVPSEMKVENYIPEYGWDKQGWISFREQK